MAEARLAQNYWWPKNNCSGIPTVHRYPLHQAPSLPQQADGGISYQQGGQRPEQARRQEFHTEQAAKLAAYKHGDEQRPEFRHRAGQ